MSRYVPGKYENFVNPDTGETITIKKIAKRNNEPKGEFVRVWQCGLNNLSIDLAETSFQAAMRTYVEILKRLSIGSDEVTIYPNELMRILNLSEMTVRTHLKILEKKGYIQKKYKEKGRHTYTVCRLVADKG